MVMIDGPSNGSKPVVSVSMTISRMVPSCCVMQRAGLAEKIIVSHCSLAARAANHRTDTRPLGVAAAGLISCRLSVVRIRAKRLPSAEGTVGRDIYEAPDMDYMVMNACPSRHMLDSPGVPRLHKTCDPTEISSPRSFAKKIKRNFDRVCCSHRRSEQRSQPLKRRPPNISRRA